MLFFKGKFFLKFFYKSFEWGGGYPMFTFTIILGMQFPRIQLKMLVNIFWLKFKTTNLRGTFFQVFWVGLPHFHLFSIIFLMELCQKIFYIVNQYDLVEKNEFGLYISRFLNKSHSSFQLDPLSVISSNIFLS